MKNYWLNNYDEFGLPKIDMAWIRQRWHVKVTERERHLWPGKYLVSGWYEDEDEDYEKAKTEWEKGQQEAWDKKPKITIQEHADGSATLDIGGEDYFHWNVTTPGWSLHKDGTWNKMLVKNFGQSLKMEEYPGVYNSYEEALITLGKSHSLPMKFEGYDKHLDHVVQNYDYTLGKMRWDL